MIFIDLQAKKNWPQGDTKFTYLQTLLFSICPIHLNIFLSSDVAFYFIKQDNSLVLEVKSHTMTNDTVIYDNRSISIGFPVMSNFLS